MKLLRADTGRAAVDPARVVALSVEYETGVHIVRAYTDVRNLAVRLSEHATEDGANRRLEKWANQIREATDRASSVPAEKSPS